MAAPATCITGLFCQPECVLCPSPIKTLLAPDLDSVSSPLQSFVTSELLQISAIYLTFSITSFFLLAIFACKNVFKPKETLMVLCHLITSLHSEKYLVG